MSAAFNPNVKRLSMTTAARTILRRSSLRKPFIMSPSPPSSRSPSTAPPSRVLEGILAVNKPTATTSTDVIRQLQNKLTPSPLFEPYLSAMRAMREAEPRTKQRDRRDKRRQNLKIGHGGTLDPLATGVLIAGIGGGTKALSRYLACTKTYETVVLFGVESDSFDVLGKVTGAVGCDAVNEAAVRDALGGFRGKFEQIPPVFSARRINGVRLYDMARAGVEVPDGALQPRPVEVTEMELLEYWDAGEHEFVMRTEDREEAAERYNKSAFQRKDRKRKRKEDAREQKKEDQKAKVAKTTKKDATNEDGPFMSGALPVGDAPLETKTNNAEELTEKADADEVVENYTLGPATFDHSVTTSERLWALLESWPRWYARDRAILSLGRTC
jgi:tRNA pseudouridine55 synthase